MIVHSERLIPAALLVLAFRWYRSRRFDLSLPGNRWLAPHLPPPES